jgi:hypothetical protein
VILTGAGRGYEAAHITFPLDGAMRLGLLSDVHGRDMLLAVTGTSTDQFDGLGPILDTFRAEAQPFPSTSTLPGP